MGLRLVILGAGSMARAHALAFAAIDGVELVGAVEPDADRRAAFVAAHGIPRGFATLAEALDWGRFDAAANVTPDAVHHPTTLALLAAGKHVLCEKPLATNAADAAEMAAAAAAAGVVAMVNLTYRNVAAMQRARAMIAAGEIGQVRHFEAAYLQSWLTQPAWGDWRSGPQWLWRLSTAHGSAGALGDIGIHIVDFATWVAGDEAAEVSARLATFDKAPGGRIGAYVLDANDSFAMTLRLAGGALGVVHASRFASGHVNDLRLRIHGTRGGLDVGYRQGEGRLRHCAAADLADPVWRTVPCDPVPTNYARFIAAIRGEGPAEPDFARGAALQRVLDAAVRSDAGGGGAIAL